MKRKRPIVALLIVENIVDGTYILHIGRVIRTLQLAAIRDSIEDAVFHHQVGEGTCRTVQQLFAIGARHTTDCRQVTIVQDLLFQLLHQSRVFVDVAHKECTGLWT